MAITGPPKHPARFTAVAPCGFTTIEAVVSTLIVGVLLVASLNTVGMARARRVVADRRKTPQLAQQLVTEILQCHYQEPVDTPQFGRESESGSDRTTWDDVDDYDGWSSSPPQLRDGTTLADYAGWQRSVEVRYVDPLAVDNVVATDEGLKRITVTITAPDGAATTRVAYRGVHSIYEHQPYEDTEYVTWVGLEIQVGDDPAGSATTGVNLLNLIPTGLP